MRLKYIYIIFIYFKPGQDATSDHQDLISDEKPPDAEESEKHKDAEEILSKDTPRELARKRMSDVSLDQDLEDYQRASTEAEDRKAEEIYKDSLNVTPEVVDVPPRPDSLEPEEDEREKKLKDGRTNDDAVRNNTSDDLKDRLIEIEMAERNIEKALTSQQTATCNKATSEVEKSMTVKKMNETRKPSSETEESVSEIRKSTSEQGTLVKEKISINEKIEQSANKEEKENNNIEKSTNEREVPNEEAINKNEEELTNKVEKESNNAEKLTDKRELPNEERKAINKETEEFLNKEKESDNVEKLTNERAVPNEGRKAINKKTEEFINNERKSNIVKKSTNEIGKPMEMSKSESKVTTEQTESSVANEKPIPKEESKDEIEISAKEVEKLPNGVEEVMIKRHVAPLECANIRSQIKDDKVAKVSVHEKDDKDAATKDDKATTANISIANSGSMETLGEHLRTTPPANGSDIGRSKTRKKRETNELPVTAPLSLKIPFSYVLSEGSPCEIPDSVTTVIIPDRPCPSPVIPEIEDHQSGSTYRMMGKATK